MRTIKQILVILLVLLLAGQLATNIYLGSSDKQDPPKIYCEQKTLDVSATDGSSVLLTGITANDPQDGDLTSKVIVGSVSKLISENTAKVTYLVFDSDDNMASCSRYIRYTDYRRPRLYVKSALHFSSTDGVNILESLGATDVLDGDISSQVRVSTLSATENSEIFNISIQVTNSVGDTSRQELPVLIQPTDHLRPVIKLTNYLIYLKAGTKFYPEDYISSATVIGQNIPMDAISIDNPADTETPGTYRVFYTYDNNGHLGTAIMTVVVQ